MNNIKIAGCALNQTPLDWTGNLNRIRESLQMARKEGIALFCLPELCITGYGCEDAFFHPHVCEEAMKSLIALAPETKGIAVSIGLPVYHHGVIYNCSAMVADGNILGFVPKKSLAGDGVHYEPRWFKAWESGRVDKLLVGKTAYPFGDVYFKLGGVKVGFEICEEAWVANRPGVGLARKAVDVILNPSASHFAFGKLATRQRFVCEGSRAYNVVYVYSNLIGNESGRIIFDGGVLIANQGEIIAQGPRFSFKDIEITSQVVEIEKNRVARARTYSYSPESDENPDQRISYDFPFPQQAYQEGRAKVGDTWENSSHLKEEELARSVSLGLFDFLRKSRQSGFVVSLSGGVDSAAVAILCRIALDLAKKDLGLDGLKKKLSHIAEIQKMSDTSEMAKAMITCAYQSTKNSSDKTLHAAEAVAKDIQCTFYKWSVDDILKGYQGLVEQSLGQKLSWEKNDIALQNIQARTRGPSIWMMANIKNALLLATSNRSEASVGYATMDGDTCGSLSPIGGIDKNFLKQWAMWLSQSGPEGLRPFPSFKTVLENPPTAELRPLERHQTDENDLMPYNVLDRIERLAIRDKKSPQDIWDILVVEMKDTSKVQLKDWVVKFFRLWSRNQWKRERYAPAFHVDDESLDPKTWCRFPILSGGYEDEISRMK